MDTTFREAVKPQEEKSAEKPAEVTGIVDDPENIPRSIDTSNLENWEIQNGKYGLEYMGIKNIADTFPLKMQFGMVDKYIREEMEERGVDKTPANWQSILKEIEDEIGIEKNAYKRMERLSNYIKVVNRMKALKKLKEKYLKV